jgi:glutaredoxin
VIERLPTQFFWDGGLVKDCRHDKDLTMMRGVGDKCVGGVRRLDDRPSHEDASSDNDDGPDPLPSIALVHCHDAARASRACDAVVCLLTLEGCASCVRFAPTWMDACAKFRGDGLEGVMMVHVELTAATKASAAPYMHASRRKFPTVCTFVHGQGGALPYDGDYDALDATRLLALVSRHITTQRDVYDTMTVTCADMYDEEVDDDAATEDDEEVDDAAIAEEEHRGGCGGTARPTVPKTEVVRPITLAGHGVDVTHDVSPHHVEELARGAHSEFRVCVLYHTNWCGHCTRFKPVYNECVARSCDSKLAKSIAWCAVDCDDAEGSKVAERAGVRGFPMLVVHHEFPETYDGARTADALWRFVTRRSALLTPRLLANRLP